MNLAYKWPAIYWNTACLSVNAGGIDEEDYFELLSRGILEISDEEDRRKSGKVQYGKIASAISKFSKYTNIKLPDINVARFGFVPDAKNNNIIFGLKGVSRIGDDLLRVIMDKRPYTSLEHFIEKMSYQKDDKTLKLISKDRVINLIKAGAFDKLEGRDRRKTMKKYIRIIADKKQNINLQNFNMLIDKGFIPEKLSFESKVYKFTKYIRKSRGGSYYLLDEIARDFLEENEFRIINDAITMTFDGEKKLAISSSSWDNVYNNHMDDVRDWMKEDQTEIRHQLNHKLYMEEYEKYASGSELRWELEALSFYHSGHELKDVEFGDMHITELEDLREDDVIGHWNFNGKVIAEYQISHIVGTVLDKDKTKHIITLATPGGVINVKLWNAQFAKYDHKFYHIDEVTGKKIIDEDSFLKKGTFLMISGIKRGDVFTPKVYKKMGIDPIYRIDMEDGKFVSFEEKSRGLEG
jgi:DNA polymerase-3 subunit alpha